MCDVALPDSMCYNSLVSEGSLEEDDGQSGHATRGDGQP